VPGFSLAALPTAAAFGLGVSLCQRLSHSTDPDTQALDGPSGTDKDFTDLHAWCEVYLPGAGWIGLDNQRVACREGHLLWRPRPDQPALHQSLV